MSSQNDRGRLSPRPTKSTPRPDATPSSQVLAEEAKVSWRPSRHARRLLTLAAAALLMALLTRNPALAGVAGPPLLLLGMARVSRGRAAGGGRPDVAAIRVGLTSTRVYEGEPVARRRVGGR